MRRIGLSRTLRIQHEVTNNQHIREMLIIDVEIIN